MLKSAFYRWMWGGGIVAGLIMLAVRAMRAQETADELVLTNWHRLGVGLLVLCAVVGIWYALVWRRRQREINAAPRRVVSLAPALPRQWTETPPGCDFWRRAPVGQLPERGGLPGNHISLELGGDAQRLVYTLTAPPEAAVTLAAEAQGEWPGVAVRPMAADAGEIRLGEAGDVLVDLPCGATGTVWRWRTLKLAKADVHPLQIFPKGYNEPPPKQMDSLLAAVNVLPSGVTAGVQVLVRPAPASRRRSWEQQAGRLRARLHNRGSSSRTQTSHTEGGGSVRQSTSQQIGPRNPDELERALRRLTERLEGGPLYEVCLRVWCCGDEERLVASVTTQLAQMVISATLGPFNRLQPGQRGRDGVAVLSRHFPIWGGFPMTAAELGQLMHLPRPEQMRHYPRLHTAGPGELEPEGRLVANPAACTLPATTVAELKRRELGGETARSSSRVGKDAGWRAYGFARRGSGQEVLVGQPFRDATMHTFITGSTGVGKSVLAANVVLQDWLAGHSALVIDPHRTLIDDILRGVPAARQQDVVILDLADTYQPFRFNLFDVVGDGEAGVERLLAAIRAGMGASWDASVGMQEVLWHAVVLTQLTAAAPSMTALAALLEDKARARVLRELAPTTPAAQQTLDFWQEQFPSWTLPDQKRALNAARRRVETFTRRPQVRRTLGMAGSTVNLAAALNAGKLVLCPMHEEMGSETKRIWSTILMQEVIRTLMARSPGADLPQVTVAIDELAESVGTLADGIGTLLNETRKYGAAVVLLNQSYVSLPEDVRQVILTNCRSHVVFSLGVDDARVAQQVLGPQVAVDDIRNLRRFCAYARLTVSGEQAAPCLLRTPPPPQAETLGRLSLPTPPAELVTPQTPKPDNCGPHLDAAGLVAWGWKIATGDEEERAQLLQILSKLSPQKTAAVETLWQQGDAWGRARLLAAPGIVPEPVVRLPLLSQLQYGIPWWWSDAAYLRALAAPDSRDGSGAAIVNTPL